VKTHASERVTTKREMAEVFERQYERLRTGGGIIGVPDERV
jgi:hypothetical protein